MGLHAGYLLVAFDVGFDLYSSGGESYLYAFASVMDAAHVMVSTDISYVGLLVRLGYAGRNIIVVLERSLICLSCVVGMGVSFLKVCLYICICCVRRSLDFVAGYLDMHIVTVWVLGLWGIRPLHQKWCKSLP